MTPLSAHIGSRPGVELRLHPKLRDVWPPEPGGAFGPGTEFPLGGQDVLEQVFYYAPVADTKANVSLKTFYKGQYHTRDLLLRDVDFAEKLASRLRTEIGRTIADLGQIELDF
jgi:hypothetical protein